MDGLAAVTARVQQIQGLVQSMQQPPVRTTLGGITTSGSSGDATGVSATSGAFAQVLAQAKATQSAGSATVDADGVPRDLKAYGNGKVPASALQGVGVGSHRLWAPAAEAFTQLRAAAKADGVTIGVTDSYRTFDSQVDLARRKGLYKDGGLAAVPGTSDHGWGLSLDLKLDSRAQTWMRANAGRFGFDENTPREPWHWTFQP